jgi:Trypsin
MHLPLRFITRAVVAAACAVLLVAAPAGAIVGGTSDTGNTLPSVGVLQLKVGADWFDFCSGTLVRSNVVLTAAHCTDFLVDVGPDGFGPNDLRITFDPTPDAGSTYYATDHIVVNPAWFAAGPCFGNSKNACLSPGHEDIALVYLKSNVGGVTPSPIAGPGYLDRLNLKTATFTVAGYGTDAYITGSAAAPNPNVLFDGIRSYRVVSALPAKDAFPDRFLKVTKSVCFGDSGGPLFHNGVVVALNTWTFSYRCDGPNLEYRTDSAPAQAFLDANGF